MRNLSRLLRFQQPLEDGWLNTSSLEGIGFDSTTSETDDAVQGMAGLTYRFDDGSELGLGYKYLVAFPSTDNYAQTHSIMVTNVRRC